MANGRRGQLRGGADFWPGFVDATATLLLLVTFLLALFALGTYILSREAESKDTVLLRLQSQLSELGSLLALERREKADLEQSLLSLRQTLTSQEAEQQRLRALAEGGAGAAKQTRALEKALEEEKDTAAAALAEADFLNRQIQALRGQLASLQTALEASEARDRESQARIIALGRRLNTALAQKVQELSRYRSNFMAALRKILGGREGFEIVGDRFILRSEVLFESGSANVSPRGKWELRKIAEALQEVSTEIPQELSWVLRVDGHTDSNPIATVQFPSNWHLSAARALAVVEYLIDRGVPPERLVAAGFGEFWPLDERAHPEAWQRNRRIEFKLTER